MIRGSVLVPPLPVRLYQRHAPPVTAGTPIDRHATLLERGRVRVRVPAARWPARMRIFNNS